MLNRRQVLGCIGAACIMPASLLKPRWDSPTVDMWCDDHKRWHRHLTEKELHICELMAKVMVGDLICKTIDDQANWKKSFRFNVRYDPTVCKIQRIGWYCWVDPSNSPALGYATSIDCRLDVFPSIRHDTTQIIMLTSAPVSKCFQSKCNQYWDRWYVSTYFDKQQHLSNLKELESIC